MEKINSNAQMPPYGENDVICRCMSIRRYELKNLQTDKKWRKDIDRIMNGTGGGTVCSGCQLLLREYMGEEVWTPVRLESVTEPAPDIKRFRFVADEPFEPALAGQYIVVQAYIEGRWEQRNYTLTSPAEEQHYREITVRRKSNGLFSTWLHSLTPDNDTPIRVSAPMGRFTPNLVGGRPLVCFVGGIGVTPAISFMRTIREGADRPFRPLLVDYSIRKQDDFILDAWEEKFVDNEEIKLNFRITGMKKDGSDHLPRLDEKQVIDVVGANKNADYYICGPDEYVKETAQHLGSAGVRKSNINVESFAATESEENVKGNPYFYIGLALFSAFIIQDLAQLKTPWLEAMQAQLDFKIYSGLLLLFYLFLQFPLAYNKASHRPHLSADTYEKHRMRGVWAPLFFYIHSTGFGETYLLVLSLVYFSSFITGLFGHDRIKDPVKRRHYFKYWLLVHVTLSVVLMAFIGFHIYVVSSY